MSLVNRRLFLLGGLSAGIAAVAGCAANPRSSPDRPTAGKPTSPPAASPASTDLETQLQQLERTTGRQIGCFVSDLGTGESFAYRGDQPFPMCSTYKTLAVAATVARSAAPADLRAVVRYTRADLLDYAPITSKNLNSGMTVDDLCAAAISYSDNTAANLLVARLGGAAQVTEYVCTQPG